MSKFSWALCLKTSCCLVCEVCACHIINHTKWRDLHPCVAGCVPHPTVKEGTPWETMLQLVFH